MGVEITVPDRTPKDSAGLVMFRDDERRDPIAVIETEKDGISDNKFNQELHGATRSGAASSTMPARRWSPSSVVRQRELELAAAAGNKARRNSAKPPETARRLGLADSPLRDRRKHGSRDLTRSPRGDGASWLAKVIASAVAEKGGGVADLLDRICKELTARLAELRPLVEEHKRLEAALGALNQAQGAAPKARATNASATATATASRRRRTGSRGSAGSRKRAPRGANRQAVLRALQERPGASSGELAAVSGVEHNTLQSLLARLVRDGELEKHELPNGRMGYALSDRRPDEPIIAVAVGTQQGDQADPSPPGEAAE